MLRKPMISAVHFEKLYYLIQDLPSRDRDAGATSLQDKQKEPSSSDLMSMMYGFSVPSR